MATPIQMPALSPTMKEGKITRWLKKEGDKVSAGEAIAEVETDKSNLEVEAYDDGVLLKISVGEGESAKVGSPIAFVGEKGEKVDAAASSAKSQAQPPPAAPQKAPAQAAPQQSAAPARRHPMVPRKEAEPQAASAPQLPPTSQGRSASGRNGRLRISPLARKMAEARGLPLESLSGSGPNGRIIKRDVESAGESGARPSEAKAAGKAPAVSSKGAPAKAPAFGVRAEPTATPVSTMRKVIAQRMTEVKPGVPHFYLTIEVEMDAAARIREEAKATDQKISVNDILVKATAVALRRFPKVNVQFHGDRILQLHTADVGIAVAIEDGLITPVIKDADLKGLAAIAAETRDLAERARRKALKPDEYTGGSITVSNLGMFGIDEFIAVINPPQAAILAVGAVAEKAVVRDGQLAVRKMMSVTLSGDHRAIDGALGAQYLQELKALLEHPMRLLF